MTTGRVLFVVGATGGIGRAITTRLVGPGDRAVLHHVGQPDQISSLIEEVQRAGATADDVDADLREAAAATQLVNHVLDVHGGIDVLINAAGVMWEHPTPDERQAVWDVTIAVNLTAAYLIAAQAGDAMVAAGGGVMINVASQLAFKGAAGLAAYCASKAGVVGMTRALARELGPTVRVYALAPGPVETGMIAGYADDEWRRARTATLIRQSVARPDEVAEIAHFAVQETAGLMQGQTLHCNGGGVLQ